MKRFALGRLDCLFMRAGPGIPPEEFDRLVDGSEDMADLVKELLMFYAAAPLELAAAVKPLINMKDLKYASGIRLGKNARRIVDNARKVPRGFSSADEFASAGKELAAALKQSKLRVRQMGVRGSSVTDISSKGGCFRYKAANGKPASDIDVYVELADNVDLSTSKKISGFIHPDKLMRRYPALRAWSDKWSKILGREITPGGFQPGTLTDPDVVQF